MLREHAVSLDRFYYCPHHPTEGAALYRQICDCRKPAPGMFLRAAKDLNIDLQSSYMVGDRLLDMEAAQTVGVTGVLVKTGHHRDGLQDDGSDRLTEENKPDFIAADMLEAVQWILRDRK
jgi:histidinol phosphatase-like enzyme